MDYGKTCPGCNRHWNTASLMDHCPVCNTSLQDTSQVLVSLIEEVLSNPKAWEQFRMHQKDPVLLPEGMTAQEYFAKERAANIAAVLVATFSLTPIE